MKRFFAILLTTLLLTWFLGRARTAKPKKVSEGWSLHPVHGVLFFFWLGIIGGGFLVFLGLRGPAEDRNMVVLGGLGWAMFSILAWPKSVYVESTGLRQRSWHGGQKLIPWKLVAYVKEQRDRSIIVGTGSEKIVLSKFHAGREFLLHKLAEHGKHLPTGPKT